MARRKNTKRIDPRYFLNETTHRDLNEQEQPAIALQSLLRGGWAQLRQRYGDNVVLKVPGNELYFRVKRTSKRGPDGDNSYGIRIDYSTAPDMSQSGTFASVQPGDTSPEAKKAVTDPASFIVQALSKKTDKVEIIPPQ